MTKFFRKGGSEGQFLRAIYSIDPNDATRLSFGINPKMEELESGYIINNVVEISKKEFDHWVENWILLSKNLDKENFRAITGYRVITNNVELIGYSDKETEELLDFLESRRNLGFYIKDEDGTVIHSIGSDIAKIATFSIWEL